MPTARQVQFVKESLLGLAQSMYAANETKRDQWLQMKASLRKRSFVELVAEGLYGDTREAKIPGLDKRIVLLRLRERVGPDFDLVVIGDAQPRPKRLTCFVGHRFTGEIERQLRWNLRELFEIFGIDADYVGFDGAAVSLLAELQKRIKAADFCLFDNRQTTEPSKPNVYIEAGMALAMKRPFIFCHYKQDVWPADFGGVLYVPYDDYRGLCTALYAKMPHFLKRVVDTPKARARR